MAASRSDGPTPVYIPYATLLTALSNLRKNGIPGTGKIDKTIWDNLSGAVQGQLILGFRFLGFTDEVDRVQPLLVKVVKADDEQQKIILRDTILERYKRVIDRGLETISPGQLDEAFREFKIQGSTLVRAIRFFVKACQELGIPISKRVAEKTRATNGTPTRRRRHVATRASNGQANGTNGSADTGKEKSNPDEWDQMLLRKFPEFDAKWPDELKAKWFEGFERLMRTGRTQ